MKFSIGLFVMLLVSALYGLIYVFGKNDPTDAFISIWILLAGIFLNGFEE